MDVADALLSRRSVRGFLPTPIPEETLRAIFERAQRAPSWCNIQPWKVWVASGVRAETLKSKLLEAASSQMPSPDVDWPADYPGRYGELRRECGAALYSAMGVARDDRAARHAAWLRNYEAFGAPHVALVGIDRAFGLYAALDVGCWLQSVLLAATEEGIATCSQASLATFPDVAREVLEIPDHIAILFGISLGYEDPDADANRCHTAREPLEDNVRFLG